MTTLLTHSLKNKLIQLLMLVGLPLLGRAQTVIVNYDFNNASAYPVAPVATAAGITSTATSSEAFATGTGMASGAGAYAGNPAGPALAMSNSSGLNTKYFEFILDGAALPKYSAFKIYLQGYRSGTGATTLTLQYSVNEGKSYFTFGSTYAPGSGSFTEGGFDLSGLPSLDKLTSLRLQLLASGASGNGTLRIDNFQVQAINTVDLLHWTGEAGTDSWFDANNWKTGNVPTSTDEVILDHLYKKESYTVTLDQNKPVSIRSLIVNPGAGEAIFVEVPATNELATALTLSNTGVGAVALAIHDKGVVTNASGATSGSGVVVAGNSGATVFIYNGGRYRHASRRGHAEVVNNLGSTSGTELGIFEFQLPANGPGSYSLSLSNRAYGTLVLLNRPGQDSTSYTGAGTALTVQGDLLIGPKVTFSPAINNDLKVIGDIVVQGRLQIKPTTPPSPTSQLLLMGDKPQRLAGKISIGLGIGLAINNPAGVTLATPLLLSGPLALTRGILTTTVANLLTLRPTASIAGGSDTSYVNGPLARKTDAGALDNLLFPTGSAAAYRPLTLSATAQDATTYLVTQTEGPAPDFDKLPLSASTLPRLTRVSQVRSYTITPTPAANNFSGRVKLTFEPDDQVDAPTDGSLTIGKNSGGSWQNIGNSSVVVPTPAPAGGYASGTVTSGIFTSFSTFALASTGADTKLNPLPVTLISFTARRREADVVLSWATATELHNARFEVQRSLDGQQFTTVTAMAGHGTAATAHQYAARDPAVPSGPLYYRLAQVDESGATTFSPVIALAAATTATLYPNPARDRLTVPAPAGTPVQILDLLGRVVQALALPPSGEVSVAALLPGSYVLQTGEDAQAQRFKFSKE